MRFITPIVTVLFISQLSAVQAENKVLFIGNSFTIGSSASVPGIFDALAIAGGHDDPLTVMRAVGGQDYQYHVQNATSQSEIGSESWTHVVMQNYSTQPTHIGDVAEHLNFGAQLYDLIMANSALTEVILFETWSRAANHSLITGTSTSGTFATTAEMQEELRTNYNALATSLNAANPANPPVRVGPVGDAWEQAGGLLAESDPGFADLHGGDNYHGNDNGYFLAAAVFYSVIYGESPVGLRAHPAVTALGLNLTEDSTVLEQTAWETVQSSLDSPPVFQTEPVSQTVTENSTVVLSASVKGTPPFTVEWLKDGQVIPDETVFTLTIPQISSASDGSEYRVRVSNAFGQVTSSPAVISVISDNDPPVAQSLTLADPLTVVIEFDEVLAGAGAAQFAVVSKGRIQSIQSAVLSPGGTQVTLNLTEAVSGGVAVVIAPGIADVSGNLGAESDVLTVAGTSQAAGADILLDFGGGTGGGDDPLRQWNNVTGAIGSSNSASLSDLISTSGDSTGVSLQMVRRFNGTNQSGTTASAHYPASATRNSLYGNTETFNNLSNVFPAFRISGLSTTSTYSFTMYASRLGVSDNRETLYTLTGEEVSTAVLNPANNVDDSATVSGIVPAPDGSVLVELAPSVNNTNSNHFTYLGVLAVTEESTSAVPEFYNMQTVFEKIILDWAGSASLETNSGLEHNWTEILPAPEPPYAVPKVPGGRQFYRLRYPED